MFLFDSCYIIKGPSQKLFRENIRAEAKAFNCFLFLEEVDNLNYNLKHYILCVSSHTYFSVLLLNLPTISNQSRTCFFAIQSVLRTKFVRVISLP